MHDALLPSDLVLIFANQSTDLSRSALRVMVLHAMDISNPAKVLPLSDKWSDSLLKVKLFYILFTLIYIFN